MRISDWSFRRVLFRSRNTLAALSEFEDLNDAVRPTGGVVNKVSNWFKDALGNDELSRMEQLSLGMARGMRQPGEGAVSDFEGKLFAKMAGGYNRPYGTNVAFAQAGKSLAQRQIDMQQFREAYLQANGNSVGSTEENTS